MGHEAPDFAEAQESFPFINLSHEYNFPMSMYNLLALCDQRAM